MLLVLSYIFRDVLDDPSLEVAAGNTPEQVPGWDSLRHIALVAEAECRFRALFAPEEVAGLISVGRWACAIAWKQHVSSLAGAPV
jgi:hypothetical protein